MSAIQLQPARQVRQAAVAKARLLNLITSGWNPAEGVVAVLAGVAAAP